MTNLDMVWRLARLTAYLFVAGYGLMGGTYIGFSFTHPEFALNAIGDIGMAAAAEYVRVYHLQA